jgi:hypothetical protein
LLALPLLRLLLLLLLPRLLVMDRLLSVTLLAMPALLQLRTLLRRLLQLPVLTSGEKHPELSPIEHVCRGAHLDNAPPGRALLLWGEDTWRVS